VRSLAPRAIFITTYSRRHQIHGEIVNYKSRLTVTAPADVAPKVGTKDVI